MKGLSWLKLAGLNRVLGLTAERSSHQPEALRQFLAKAVSGTFGFKILNVGLMYANSLLMVRLAGARGYGEYAYIIAWTQILLIPAALGFEGLISRELAVYSDQRLWARAKGLLGFSNRLVLLNSVLIAAIAIVGFGLLGLANSAQSWIAFAIGLAALPFLALSRLRAASLQAIKHIVASQLPEAIVRPGILFICLGGLFSWQAWMGDSSPALAEPWQDLAGGVVLSSPQLMGINWVATAIAFSVGGWLLSKSLDPALQSASGQHSRRSWLKAAMPMLLIGSMYVINGQTDAIMLGSLKDAETVGVYAVANRGAGLISFVQIAFATSLAPVFATLFAQNQLDKLRQTIKHSARATFLLSLAVAVGLALLSRWFLLLFGAEFLVGQTALFVLMGGQLVNAFTGATAQLLIMTGYDRDTAVGVSISAGANVVLNAVLIPLYGLNGAAIATAMSTVLWNTILVGFTYRRFKVLSTAL